MLVRMFCFLLLLFVSSHACSIETLELGDVNKAYPVGQHLYYLIDPDYQYNTEQLIDALEAGNDGQFNWQALEKDTFSGMDSGHYWFAIKLENTNAKHIALIVEYAYPYLNDVNLIWIPDNSERQSYKTGHRYPFSERPVDNLFFLFPIDLEPNNGGILLIEVWDRVQFMYEKWQLMGKDYFLERKPYAHYAQWFYFGVVGIMLVYNFMVFLLLRKKTYLYFVAFGCFTFLLNMTVPGYAFEVLWPDYPRFNERSPILFAMLVYLANLYFYIEFIDVDKKMPKFARSLRVLAYLNVPLFLLMSWFNPAEVLWAVIAVVLLMTIFYIVSIAVAVYFSIKGSHAARYYCFAFLIYYGLALGMALQEGGFLEPNIITAYGGQLGHGIMLVVLSIALGDRISRDLRREVFNRTCQLEQSNQETLDTLQALKRTQQELIDAEKMSALGGLVAGVAHEINTPVGIGVTACSHLASQTGDFTKKYHKDDLSRDDLDNYLVGVSEATSMILSNLKRAAELIHSFKQVAVDQSSEEHRQFHIQEYIDEILASLHPQLKKTQHKVVVDCPEDIVINSVPGALFQILTNLIMNSLIHGFERMNDGVIDIKISKVHKNVHISYKDSGCGISEKNIKKIFEPFFTTRRGQGGSGLGMHIVYNLATQKLGGNIDCRSVVGQGTQFDLKFPVNLQQ